MFLGSLNIPGSGLTAEQYRLNLIAQNIANAQTTRRADGKEGPYRRKTPVYQEINDVSFAGQLGSQLAGMRGRERDFTGYLRPSETNEKVVKANNAVYVRPEFTGNALNGVSLQTSGEYIRNKYSLDKSQTGSDYNGGVRILKVVEDPTPGEVIYDPEHPDADEEGYVEMPNVNMTNEMVNMMGASRAYEANVQVVNAIKAMAMKALEIGR